MIIFLNRNRNLTNYRVLHHIPAKVRHAQFSFLLPYCHQFRLSEIILLFSVCHSSALFVLIVTFPVIFYHKSTIPCRRLISHQRQKGFPLPFLGNRNPFHLFGKWCFAKKLVLRFLGY